VVKLVFRLAPIPSLPDALQVLEEECPEPKSGEARVKVLAAGVSLPDIMMREGMHPETPTLPFTPGWDLIGVVDRLGDGVSEFKTGQVVAALPIRGAYAEYICLPQRELVLVPSGLDPCQAVSLILNYVTAYQMLHRSAKVTPGQRVLIRARLHLELRNRRWGLRHWIFMSSAKANILDLTQKSLLETT
jgi:NADPH:quinone reductase-like Zn-dependent oxidoreductase